MHRRIQGVNPADLILGAEINTPYILAVGVAAVKYRVRIFVNIILKFCVIFLRNLAKAETDEFEIQQGREAAGDILKRLYLGGQLPVFIPFGFQFSPFFL